MISTARGIEYQFLIAQIPVDGSPEAEASGYFNMFVRETRLNLDIRTSGSGRDAKTVLSRGRLLRREFVLTAAAARLHHLRQPARRPDLDHDCRAGVAALHDRLRRGRRSVREPHPAGPLAAGRELELELGRRSGEAAGLRHLQPVRPRGEREPPAAGARRAPHPSAKQQRENAGGPRCSSSTGTAKESDLTRPRRHGL